MATLTTRDSSVPESNKVNVWTCVYVFNMLTRSLDRDTCVEYKLLSEWLVCHLPYRFYLMKEFIKFDICSQVLSYRV